MKLNSDQKLIYVKDQDILHYHFSLSISVASLPLSNPKHSDVGESITPWPIVLSSSSPLAKRQKKGWLQMMNSSYIFCMGRNNALVKEARYDGYRWLECLSRADNIHIHGR